MHVHCPGEEQCQTKSLDGLTILGDHQNAEDGEQIGDGIESHSIPVPAAVMSDEVLSGLVEELVLSLQD